MHDAAWRYVADVAASTAVPAAAVDIGGRDVNGTCRDLFPTTTWTVIDAQPGDGVDVVADGATWRPESPVDLVLCTEVFEHTPNWSQIVANIHSMLNPGGRVILTMAGPGRAKHGVRADDPIQPGYYRNVAPADLTAALINAGFHNIAVEHAGDDVRATATR